MHDAGRPTHHDDANGHRDPTAGDPSILVDDLSLVYGDGTGAVDGISLSIPRGEFFGFLGPNGAGKTTTIKILATLLDPTGGRVEINGHDVTAARDRARETIGYMAQETSVDEELTARENLQFACGAYGVPRSQQADRIGELLDLVDLADVADTPAGHYSGGMKKRLDAATALVHDPQLVFLDEPTTGLDPKARTDLWDYFERINDAGTTVFLTTQYLEEADALCDRLAVIRDGQIVEEGSPAELKRRVGGQHLAVSVAGERAGVETAADVARNCDCFEAAASVEPTADGIRVTTQRATECGTDLLLALDSAGVDVSGFDVEEATLDDVFLAIADEGTADLDSAAPAPEVEG